MFKNHLKIAFRQLIRNKAFSTLNILGLSLGMALAILISIFIKNEFAHDNWMADSDRTYRVYRIRGNSTSWTPSLLARKMATDYPEVELATGYAPDGEQLLSYAGNDLYVKETAMVDSTFFEVLSMDFLHGDPATALDQPNGMVISDDLATKIFGNNNPMGEVITYGGTDEFIVTGVVDRNGKKSHIVSDVFKRFRWYGNSWAGNNRATYTKLKPNANPVQLAGKIEKDVNQLIEQEYLTRNYKPNADDFFSWALQPLNDVYLRSEGWTSLDAGYGSMRNVYIYAMIAILVLLVAIVNYVNLTTARATQRSKEVGVKKVAGAGRWMLTRQFITESMLQAVVAGMIALIIAELTTPFFNRITDRNLEVIAGDPLLVLTGTLGLALFIGLLAGIYPAFVMSGFKPVTALKSNFLNTGEKGVFRKILVTGQFATSITLLIVMAFIYRQVNFMMNTDLGFQANQVLTIPMNDDNSWRKVQELKSRFKQIPGVEEVTTANYFPGDFFIDWTMMIEGRAEAVNHFVLFADEDFDDALNIEMIAGRFIDTDFAADSINNFVVNAEFVKRYNIKNPIGKRIKHSWQNSYGQIVGVMKDFHFAGLNKEIGPLVMNARAWRNAVGIKLSAENLPQTISLIEQLWMQIEPNHPMRYSFLDENFAKQYADNQRFGQTILYATFLTLFIALLGLFGLTAFTVERRTKEIGIRKVLGASVSGIIGLLAKDFMKLISFAAIIAIPLGYLISNRWLTDFAHRTDLVWWVFAAAGLIILVVGFLTVCLQSVKAALGSPVEALKVD